MSVLAWPGTIWNQWLGWPIVPIKQYLGIDLSTGWRPVAFKIAVIIIAALVLLEIFRRLKERVMRLLGKDDWLEVDDIALPRQGEAGFTDSLDGARNLSKTIAPLKKAKQYDRIAEIYASLNRHKEAAKWFMKARDRKRAATEWALAGYTLKAAKLLMKEGDYGTAARFFEEKNDHRRAAAAYERMGNLPGAAAAYAKAGRLDEAAKMFGDYFAGARDAVEVQVSAADACFTMLESEAGRAKIPAETRRALLAPVASRFEQAKRYDLAARLFYEAGQPAHAGEVFLLIGKLEEAAKCMRAAGKTREASQIVARYCESQGRWAEAAAAYAGAGEFRRAGDCFAKINEAARAAECYERAGEYYGAALAHSHLGHFEQAILLLQKIKESDKIFDQSRALLGRCFYELHDYEHCAATLDNHLTGKRVETGNVDYFYMLALAYEQLGKLEDSQRILYRIQSVDVGFKDVAQRLSSISSRISMKVGTPPPPSTARAVDPDATQVMEMVEGAVGTRYRLEQELGRGGMGVVYLARDTQLDRPVALKFLGSLMDGSEEFRQRFIREAKAAARVNHPNIIAIYDINASLGKAHIVMEYVEGQNLSRYVRGKERLSPREAINLACQACSALDAIHKVGIVHRDIKPENLLITKGGLVKLTDFGLAKAEDARITAAHVVLGTPSYMSPEQARGVDVDARSDIYSMGLVLYEMLTGKTVFTGADVMDRQQREMPPAPSTLVEGIPEALDQIVMKCLAKNPAERFQTAAELLTALRRVPT